MFPHLSLVQNFVFGRLRRLCQAVCARLWCQPAAVLPSSVLTTLPNLMSGRNAIKMNFMPLSRLLMRSFTTVSGPENRIQNLPVKTWSLTVQLPLFHPGFVSQLVPRGTKEACKRQAAFSSDPRYFIEEDGPVFLDQLVFCVLNHFCVLPMSGNALCEALLPTVQPAAPLNLFLPSLNCQRFYFWFPRKSSCQQTESPKGKTLGIRSSLS